MISDVWRMVSCVVIFIAATIHVSKVWHRGRRHVWVKRPQRFQRRRQSWSRMRQRMLCMVAMVLMSVQTSRMQQEKPSRGSARSLVYSTDDASQTH